MNFNKEVIIGLMIPACITLLLNACENLSVQSESHKNSVIFNLTVNAEKQKIFVYNVVGLERQIDGNRVSLDDFNPFFTTNALIELESNNISFNNFIITRDSNNVIFYTNETLIPKPGEIYNLKINVGNNVITGRTIIPDNFQIISPKENQIYHYSNNKFEINTKWESNKSIYGYIVDIFYHINFLELGRYNYLEYSKVVFDTSYSFISQYLPTDTVRIKVLGFDKNYYEHVFQGKESTGVNGAYGYFGSSILKTVKVIVR